MSITKKIIVTDTNIISDLSVAGVLEEFVSLDNVYICDLVKNDEVNFKTGDNLLKKYSESNGVSVIRTLRIIKLMVEKDVIDHVRAKRGCELLMKSSSVRIPDWVILEFMKGLDKVGV